MPSLPVLLETQTPRGPSWLCSILPRAGLRSRGAPPPPSRSGPRKIASTGRTTSETFFGRDRSTPTSWRSPSRSAFIESITVAGDRRTNEKPATVANGTEHDRTKITNELAPRRRRVDGPSTEVHGGTAFHHHAKLVGF